MWRVRDTLALLPQWLWTSCVITAAQTGPKLMCKLVQWCHYIYIYSSCTHTYGIWSAPVVSNFEREVIYSVSTSDISWIFWLPFEQQITYSKCKVKISVHHLKIRSINVYAVSNNMHRYRQTSTVQCPLVVLSHNRETNQRPERPGGIQPLNPDTLQTAHTVCQQKPQISDV